MWQLKVKEGNQYIKSMNCTELNSMDYNKKQSCCIKFMLFNLQS